MLHELAQARENLRGKQPHKNNTNWSHASESRHQSSFDV